MNDKLSDFIKTLDLVDSADNKAVFLNIINSPHSHYRTFSIPKRKGGKRTITSPYPTLNTIQNLIFNKYIINLPIHDCSYAYVKNRSSIDHAKVHLGSKELLTLDVNSFFPSISKQSVYELLIRSGLSIEFSYYIAELCTFNGSLPQGACTSPGLSNTFFILADIRFESLAHTLNLKYSRYADDLAFSGDTIPRNLHKTINKILNDHNMELNLKKTKLKLEGSKKIITGVSISNNEIKAPKSFKRSLRAQIYELEKNKTNLFNMSNFDPLIYEKTIGKINYLLQLEPKNNYAISKKKTLAIDFKEFLSLNKFL